jgi:ApaG protein
MAQSPDSEVVTDGIRVHAHAEYVPDRSFPDESLHFFAYTITISNEGKEPARLLRRRWIILDANNQRQEVGGDGVVGEKPRLEPGGVFPYTSACHLPTKWGTMEGIYTMERDDGRRFDVAIGRFFLVADALKAKARR